MPYGQSYFDRASELVNRIKVTGSINSIAGLRVDSVDDVRVVFLFVVLALCNSKKNVFVGATAISNRNGLIVYCLVGSYILFFL